MFYDKQPMIEGDEQEPQDEQLPVPEQQEPDGNV